MKFATPPPATPPPPPPPPCRSAPRLLQILLGPFTTQQRDQLVLACPRNVLGGAHLRSLHEMPASKSLDSTLKRNWKMGTVDAYAFYAAAAIVGLEDGYS